MPRPARTVTPGHGLHLPETPGIGADELREALVQLAVDLENFRRGMPMRALRRRDRMTGIIRGIHALLAPPTPAHDEEETA
jgi:hypothetical protein